MVDAIQRARVELLVDELNLLKRHIDVRESLSLWDANYEFKIHKPNIELLGFTGFRSRYNHAIITNLLTIARHVRDLRAWEQVKIDLGDLSDETWMCIVMDRIEPVLSEAVNLALAVKDQYVRGAVVLSVLAEQPVKSENEVVKMLECRNTPWHLKFDQLEVIDSESYFKLKASIDDLWEGDEGALLRKIHGSRQHDVPDYVDINLPDIWRMEDGVIAYGFSEKVDLGSIANVISVQLNKLARIYSIYDSYCDDLFNLTIDNCPYLQTL